MCPKAKKQEHALCPLLFWTLKGQETDVDSY